MSGWDCDELQLNLQLTEAFSWQPAPTLQHNKHLEPAASLNWAHLCFQVKIHASLNQNRLHHTKAEEATYTHARTHTHTYTHTLNARCDGYEANWFKWQSFR